MASLTISNLYKSFGAVEALKGIDLSIEDGGFLVLVGPSGCGKSTLLNSIAGLEEITSGEIMIGDNSVAGLHPSKRNIAMVYQSYALYPNKTVSQKISFGIGASLSSFIFFFLIGYLSKYFSRYINKPKFWRNLNLFIILFMSLIIIFIMLDMISSNYETINFIMS